MAERLRNAIENIRVPVQGAEISFTASFGVAHKADHQNLDELISEADRYLYKAKESGRNRICSREA
jgi:diguanylate cyclase (GGDEF)-like protein